MIKKCLMIHTLCLYVVLVILTPSSWAIMMALSIDGLVDMSESIITASVVQVESKWSMDGESIVTHATVKVLSTSKGQLGQETIVVEYLGGEVGEIGLWVEDSPKLQEGEQVVLFLKSATARGLVVSPEEAPRQEGAVPVVYNIVGKAQGKYTIDGDGMARKSGFSVPSGLEITDEYLPLEELKEKIKEATNE